MGTYISTFADGMAFMFFLGAAYRISLNGYKIRTNLIFEVLLVLLATLELKDIFLMLSGTEHLILYKISLFIDILAMLSYSAILLFTYSPRRDMSADGNLGPTAEERRDRFTKITVALTVCMACWVAGCLNKSIWIDVSYELTSIPLWLIVLSDVERKPRMEMVSETAVDIVEREGKDEKDEESNDSDKEEEAIFPFREQLNKVMQEDVLYRNPHLTITEVANAIGTNRTYLSAYLNNVLHTSFYDYINNYRIENVSKKLLAEPIPNKTIEEIAELSGFNSTSTFRRAFIKNTGMTPLHFRKVAMKDEG